MQTLVPIGTFEAKALDLLGENGFNELLAMLAKKPKAGPMIRGTGGLRKIRIASSGQGKRGGARVIYYYYNVHKPILLLLIYAKAKTEDMTDAQKAVYKKLCKADY